MRASVRERFEDLEGELVALSGIVDGLVDVLGEVVGRLPARVPARRKLSGGLAWCVECGRGVDRGWAHAEGCAIGLLERTAAGYVGGAATDPGDECGCGFCTDPYKPRVASDGKAYIDFAAIGDDVCTKSERAA